MRSNRSRASTPGFGRWPSYAEPESMSRRLPTTDDGDLPGGLVQWLKRHAGSYELCYRTGRQYNPVVDLRSEAPSDVVDELPMHIDPLLQRLRSDPPPRWPVVTLGVKDTSSGRVFAWHTRAEPLSADESAPEAAEEAAPPSAADDDDDVQGPSQLVVCPRCLRPTNIADPTLREFRLTLRDLTSANVRLSLAGVGAGGGGEPLVSQDEHTTMMDAFQGVLMQALAQASSGAGPSDKKSGEDVADVALTMRDNVLAVLGTARVTELGKHVPAINDALQAASEDEAKDAMARLQEAVPALLRLLRAEEVSQLIPLITGEN